MIPGAESDRARTLAAATADDPGLPLLDEPSADRPFLALTPQRLELRWPRTGMHPLYVDFNEAVIGDRVRSGRRDPLARALGLRRKADQSILDATCGLGHDAGVLLGLGCTVSACERSRVMWALLTDGVRRAREARPASDRLANWAGLIHDHAAAYLADPSAPTFDAVYLDPMFDAPRRRALPGREMQYLHAAVGPDPDAAGLLGAARRAGVKRVVVKRHPRQPPLAPPDDSVTGRQVCFDVYLNAAGQR